LKPSIVKNNKNLRNLNSLITNGFYKGFVGDEKFELISNHFPNNYRILGILNDGGSYDLKFDYNSTMSFINKILMILEFLASIFFLINNNWVIPITFLVTGFGMFIGFKIRERKELSYFLDKLLDLNKKGNK
jgi:hypothetical protein